MGNLETGNLIRRDQTMGNNANNPAAAIITNALEFARSQYRIAYAQGTEHRVDIRAIVHSITVAHGLGLSKDDVQDCLEEIYRREEDEEEDTCRPTTKWEDDLADEAQERAIQRAEDQLERDFDAD